MHTKNGANSKWQFPFVCCIYCERIMTCNHRWGSLLKQQSLITVYRLLTKENKLSFSVSVAANKQKFAVFRYLYLYLYMENGLIYIYICCRFKRKMEIEIQAIFLNPFTVCSACLSFVGLLNEETKGSYPFANGHIRLNRHKKNR
jgi:hypothetical protein